MKKIFLISILLIFMLSLSGCIKDNSKEIELMSKKIEVMNKEISELKDQINKDEDDVKFEISDIKYTYIDKSRKSSVVDSITIRDEEYKGLGMVNATGKNVKNTTYYLLLNYNKKGGSKQDKITNGQISVIVSKGTGVIETYDNAFMEDDIFTQPEYSFEIVGYMPFKK